jgi:hypothetical protein
MNCPICKKPMYRVVNPDGSARARCSRCNNVVDCAVCEGHMVICPKCYAKPPKEKKSKDSPFVPSDDPI